MFNLLKILGFICSFLGFLFIAKRKIQDYFAPLFIISTLTLIIYLAGLLHILYPASIVLYILGILCFFYSFFKGYCTISFTLPNLCFFIGSFFFLSFLLKANFIHYDNFSHWALVVKDMLETNAFPTRASTIIDFKNYPLGSSSWIYYGCLFLGHLPGTMLFLQGTLIFSCFYSFFAIISEKKRFLLYTFLAAGCSLLSLFNITIRINNLLVDFLLPILCLSGIAILYTLRNDLKKTWILIPILGLLGIVKNTGAIFILFVVCYYVYLCFQQKEKKYIPIFLTSYIPILLWQIHMKLEFSGMKNKFDLASASSQQKTTKEIIKIAQLYLHSCFDIHTRQALGIFVFDLVAILACIFTYKFLNKKLALIKVLVASNAMLILYYTGILGMYIFSMPLDEALYLAGFERYASSIVILFCGILTLCATIDLENSFSIKMGDHYDYKAFYSIKTKKYYQIAVMITLAICMITLLSEYNGLIYNQNLYKESLPYQVKQVTRDHWKSKGKIDHHKYLVYASDNESQVTNYYLQYITRYMLFADHVDGICLFYEDNIVNLLKDYDYLIIVESDSNEKHLLQKYFNVDGQEKIYKVSDLFSHMTKYAKQQYANIEKGL